MFKLEFDTDNAAFAPEPQPEICSILREVAELIEGGCLSNFVRDTNGNRVGRFSITAE